MQYGRKILQCCVLTGRYCQGKEGMKVAPWFDVTRTISYDSVVDNMANPGIFVVFSDNHAYPEYLITVLE